MSSLSIGKSAPPFNLPATDGRTYSLEDYRRHKKGLVVIFSCNHCPYVIRKEIRMIALGNEYHKEYIEFVLISSNDVVNYPADSFANMKKRDKEKSYPFPYLFDETQEVAKAYGALVTPHAFLFNEQLKLVYAGALDDNPDNEPRPTVEYLKNAMDALLYERIASLEPKMTQPRGCSIKWK